MSSVREYIEALGGHKSAAAHYDVGVTTISHWVVTNQFPRSRHLQIMEDAAGRGWTLDPRDPATFSTGASENPEAA